uniref:hypothetical protein n=1 Tax=Gordonia sp. B7-2 TaxID=3420932 RepID=UPI003D8B2174
MTHPDRSTTVSMYRQARRIGFSRRELFRYTALSAGAMALAACSGGDPTSEPLKKFAQGTWRVTVTKSLSSNSMSTSAPAPQDFTVTVGDGTYTATTNSWVPDNGTWTWADGGIIQIAAKKPSVATGLPDTITDSAPISWQYGNDRFAVQASWNSDTKTLTLIGTDGDGNPLPISAVKQ